MLSFLEGFNIPYLKKERNGKKVYGRDNYCHRFAKNSAFIKKETSPNIMLAYEANLLVQEY